MTMRMSSEMDNDVKEVLYSEEMLAEKVREMGEAISRDYAGKNLLLVSVLKGSVIFMADLMRSVDLPCEIDFHSRVDSHRFGVLTYVLWIISKGYVANNEVGIIIHIFVQMFRP